MNRVFVSVVTLLFLSACGGGGGGGGGSEAPVSQVEVAVVPELDFVLMGAPIDLQNIQADFASDISYDDDTANKFDIFMPESTAPTPLVIFIHGGGFTGGDKQSKYSTGPDEIRQVLSAGAAYASINYRLLSTSIDAEGVIKPLGDSRRALQFIRYYAQSLNVDPTKIVAYGGSAGAGTAIWLATSDEFADSNASDPVLAQSSRISAAGATETQSTYDLLKWETVVYTDFGITLDDIVSLSADLAQRLLNFYGITSADDLVTPAIVSYRADVDMLGLMDASDAPLWINNSNRSALAPTDVGELLHHPLHAKALLDQAQAVGLETIVNIPQLGIASSSTEGIIEFLLRHLGL
ncbi:MAG: para-nitrobenzyl esterase [Pseudomonadales bacterium]|jgi:para-nitrobenzyl esterase